MVSRFGFNSQAFTSCNFLYKCFRVIIGVLLKGDGPVAGNLLLIVYDGGGVARIVITV